MVKSSSLVKGGSTSLAIDRSQFVYVLEHDDTKSERVKSKGTKNFMVKPQNANKPIILVGYSWLKH
jgi:hypothetical protein